MAPIPDLFPWKHAAKSFQSCPTLCNPIDSSPPCYGTLCCNVHLTGARPSSGCVLSGKQLAEHLLGVKGEPHLGGPPLTSGLTLVGWGEPSPSTHIPGARPGAAQPDPDLKSTESHCDGY